MISAQELTPSEAPFLSKQNDQPKLPVSTPSGAPVGPKAVAEYSADMLNQLRDLAHGAGLTFLAYLIQVAVEEAKIQAEEHQDR